MGLAVREVLLARKGYSDEDCSGPLQEVEVFLADGIEECAVRSARWIWPPTCGGGSSAAWDGRSLGSYGFVSWDAQRALPSILSYGGTCASGAAPSQRRAVRLALSSHLSSGLDYVFRAGGGPIRHLGG